MAAVTGRPERGSMTVVAAAVVGVVVTIAVAALWLLSATLATHRARSAADLAALAGATAAQERAPAADPCRSARVVAAANGATVLACAVAADRVVSVRVSVELGAAIPGVPGRADAGARAGSVYAP